MTTTTQQILIALVAGTGLVAPTLQPAAAAPVQHERPAAHRVVHQDARQDVRRFDYPAETSSAAPRNRASDITRTVVDHRSARIVLRAQARDLARTGYQFLVAEILTSDGARFTATVDYSARPIGPRVQLSRFASGREVPCSRMSWSVAAPADRVGATIPTSCLGRPASVRVGLALVSSPRDLGMSYADDSRTRGGLDDEHLALGPRQPRA